jgi:mRNA interferase MazF
LVIERGDVYWADLGRPVASSPAKRHPVLIVQADSFNTSRINTVIAAVVTSDQRLAAAPGNVALPKRVSKLPKDSVVNVSQVVTLDKSALDERVSSLAPGTMTEVAAGLRLVLDL